MLRTTRQILFILLFAAAALAQTSQPKDVEFLSKSLGHTMHYRALLPASYETGSQKYPVLYLLHGLYGDYKNWTERTSVANYGAALHLIIVMPDANDSWYTNWVTDSQQKYEDYIIKDLISDVESRYHTLTTRDSRWIAGLSMGGYGAIKFALKYPDLFSVAASFSGALDAPTRLSSERPQFSEQLQRVYGPADSATRKDNNVYELIKQADANALPFLYLTCGSDDFLLTANRDFVAGLPAKKVRYHYQELPGNHEWPFWDRSIKMFLDEFAPTLKR